MHRACLLFLLSSLALLAIVCTDENWLPVRVVRIPEMTITASYKYEKTDEASADVVLLVTFPAHAFAEPKTWRFPLKRNPDATTPGIEWHSIRWAACGGGRGAGGGLSITGDYRSKGATQVILDLHESRGDGSSREVRGELELPWMGRALRDLPHGVWLAARFVQAK